MKQELPPYLLKTLALVAKGYKHEAMANELNLTVGAVNTYVKRLKLCFKDEQELQDPNLSSELALRLIARRYFNSSDQGFPITGSETVNLFNQLHAVTPSSDLVEFLNGLSTRIYQVSLDGSSEFSVRMGDEISNFLTEKERNVSAAALQALYEVHADILFYQGKTYTDIKLPHEVYAFTKPIIAHLRDMAKTCENAEIFGLANHLLGANYYHLDKRHNSARAYSRSLETITNKHRRLEAIRALVVNFAHLKEQYEFKKIANQAGELIEELRNED